MIPNNAFILTEMQQKVKKDAAIEIAKNLLDILHDKTIAEKTNLTLEEVSTLRKTGSL